MAITPADVKARFPEFVSVLDARIQMFIDLAVRQLNQGRFGDDYDEAMLYFVAHMLTLAMSSESGDNKGSGMITSMSAGAVSASFSSLQTDDAAKMFFHQTIYGQVYWMYQSTATSGGIVV